MINTMKALIRREFWEHRGAFIKAPIIVGLVFLVIAIGMYITALVISDKTGAEDFAAKILAETSNMNQNHLKKFWDMQMLSISSMFITVLFFVNFFFLLGSLFDDRKDGSILFWKSLPVSDATTVVSKILTAMFFVPASFVIAYFALTIIFLVLMSVIALIHGLSPVDLIWNPASIYGGLKVMVVGVFTQMIWALPIYGWLIFSSSFSSRRPFLFAVFIPSVIALSWYWINVLTFNFMNFSMFKQPLNFLGHAMVPYASGSLSGGNFGLNLADRGSTISSTISRMINSLSSIELFWGLVFCAVFVSISIWVRRYRNTT